MKDEEAISNAASRVRWLELQTEASYHEGLSNMLATLEEEANQDSALLYQGGSGPNT